MDYEVLWFLPHCFVCKIFQSDQRSAVIEGKPNIFAASKPNTMIAPASTDRTDRIEQGIQRNIYTYKVVRGERAEYECV